ncbi:MAG: WhiB family transcriptional regulator [Actinomycetota bacterium]
MSWTNDWASLAACRSADPDALFVQGAAQNRAKAVCTGCPVRTECLADALDNRVEFGVWGGMTERERRALLRRRPNVTSWRRLLETAMTEWERDLLAPRGSGRVPAQRVPTPLATSRRRLPAAG